MGLIKEKYIFSKVRREKHKLILLYKIVNNQAPGYLRNLLPDRVDNLHNHNTRQSANVLEISSKTKFYSDYLYSGTLNFEYLLRVYSIILWMMEGSNLNRI
jgi:hypothetical protein